MLDHSYRERFLPPDSWALSTGFHLGVGSQAAQRNRKVNNLVQTKNELLKHRDMLQGQVAQLTSQNQTLSAKVTAPRSSALKTIDHFVKAGLWL